MKSVNCSKSGYTSIGKLNIFLIVKCLQQHLMIPRLELQLFHGTI